MKDDFSAQEIEDALMKRAIGYDSKEVIEEYAENDGELKLTKKKVTYKNVPPDISAVKLVLDMGNVKNVRDMDDEELNNEKIRLLNILKEAEEKVYDSKKK